MTEDFDREERAFRDALAGSAGAEGFKPLDAEDLQQRRGPSRTGWVIGAAAALVVVVGLGAAVLPGLGLRGAPASAPLPVAAASEAPVADGPSVVPAAAPPPMMDRSVGTAESEAGEAAGGQSAPDKSSIHSEARYSDRQDWREETYRGVVVQVPADWRSRGPAPLCGLDWPQEVPSVFVWPADAPLPLPCPSPGKGGQPFLVFSEVSDNAWVLSPRGMIQQHVTVDDVRIDVVVAKGQAELAKQILASARKV